jgi:hypothetical protein
MATEPMPIFIKKFWTEYKPETKRVLSHEAGPNGTTIPKETFEPTGELRGVDWVAYAPIGSIQKTLLTEAVSRLSAVVPMTGRAAQNPAVQMAHARWNAIKPSYDAWKAGQEVPLDGTPLAAWPGLSPEQAELFKMKGVRTVEQIAGLTDTHKHSMGIPGLHDIIENAKRYLLAKDKTSITSALEKKDAEIAALKAQQEEMAVMIKELMEAKQEKRGPGRPPKVQDAAA